MVEKCGDDLVAARRFMNLCSNHMREIFSGGSLPLTDVINRLADIQSQAKIMQARAVYKAAQTVIDDLTKRCSVEACAGSVVALQGLIRQYETGLNEIVPKIIPAIVKPVMNFENSNILPMAENVRQKQAAQILKPLVKFADPAEQVPLVQLLSYAANDQVAKPKLRRSKIDAIMPGLTNNLLRLARTDGKSVSISYASDESLLDQAVLNLLQNQIENMGKAMIKHCVETPLSRQEKGQSQSAHLAITSRINGDRLDVLVSCDGVSSQTFEGTDLISALAELGAQSLVSTKDGLTRIEIYHIPLNANNVGCRPKREAAL